MTKAQVPETAPETLADDDVDLAQGGAAHKDWVIIESFSQPVHRPATGQALPAEDFSMNYEEIKVRY